MPIGQVYGSRMRSPLGMRRRSTDFMDDGGGGFAAPQRTAAPMGRTPFGMGARTPTASGITPASQWDPNNPFGNSPDIRSGVKFALANSGGAFGPNYLRNLLRKGAFARSKNSRRRGDIISRLAGLDPMGQRQTMVDFERDSSGELSRSLNEADIAGGRGYQDMLMRLLGMEFGQESGLSNMREEARIAEEQRGGFGDLLGGLVGGTLGQFTGGYADERGRRAGRG